jgi:SAM-dependent methyltransferase
MLIQQRARPQRYLGIDLHRGMIEWCSANLAPHAPGFEFRHHDVDYAPFNPGKGKPRVLPFPAEDASFTLVLAVSVFTHLLQDQTVHYLSECARVLSPRGVLVSTWFLFDKRYFPMMQESQNTLFINEVEPRNAVIYDREWLLGAVVNASLVVTLVGPPEVRGHQWTVVMARSDSGFPRAPFPETDFAPFGIRRAPADVTDPHLVGRTR